MMCWIHNNAMIAMYAESKTFAGRLPGRYIVPSPRDQHPVSTISVYG